MGKKIKVLIVDDEVGFARMLKMNLELTEDYEVETLDRGGPVLGFAQRFHPDVILLDVVLPDISGRDIAEKLSFDLALKRVPVIFLTATVSREDVVARSGVIGEHRCLAKPVNLQEVVTAVREVLGAIPSE